MNTAIYKEELAIVAMFSNKEPIEIRIINSSKGDLDFREAILCTFADQNKLVIKLAHNDFTFSEKVKMWQKTAETYRQMGYYTPAILSDLHGNFPMVNYKRHPCVAYAEEYAPFLSADSVCLDVRIKEENERCVWLMTARIAAAHLNHTEYPSGYCLFDVFCAGDETDEVLENAHSWIEYARTLPSEVQEQVERIWHLWETNRIALKPLYKTLPTSVFQADLNPSNILLNNNGSFVGIYDFNLCGKDVFLNYLFRETYCKGFEEERQMLYKRLKLVSEIYSFHTCEKEAVLLLYRCLKPLWINKLERLKSFEGNIDFVKEYLTQTEQALTASFEFSKYMG